MKINIKEITISDDTRVRDVQIEFETIYQFLKIEFSKNEPGNFYKNQKVNPDNIISKMTRWDGSIQLNVDEERTVAELEKDCQDLLGLSIQICRKSGNVWVVISITNSWTLQTQNTAGKFISTEMQKASWGFCLL